jgi:glycosyltransferase involved in cell wall biosynthesis
VCSEEPNIVSNNSSYITHCIATSKRTALNSCGNIPYTVIYPGFDEIRLTPTETRDSQRKKMGLGDDDFLVGMISRIGENKRQFWLMEAIQKINSEKIKAVFVGGGKDLKKLKNMNVRNCLFVGHQDDVANWYLAMDAFCILSRSEGGPTTLFESSYMKVPLIYTDCGFTKELCNSYNSFFVRDVKDLIEVIKIMHSLGKENLKRYTNNNYSIYEEFGSIEKSAKNWYKTIKDVVAKKERENCRLLS